MRLDPTIIVLLYKLLFIFENSGKRKEIFCNSRDKKVGKLKKPHNKNTVGEKQKFTSRSFSKFAYK